MTTLSLEPTLDQQFACENSSKSTVDDSTFALAQAVDEGLKHLTELFLAVCQQARSLQTKFDIAKISDVPTDRRQAKKERKEIEEQFGWTSNLVRSYAKFAEYDLGHSELLDINTIRSLCNQKYEPVIEMLQSDRLTISEVRAEMAAVNQNLKKDKEPPKPVQWEHKKTGDRLVIRLEDPDAGVEFVDQLEDSGLPLPLFLRELLRRPRIDEQVIAQEEFNEYIEEQVQQLPVSIQSEIASEERIFELQDKLRKLEKAITTADEDSLAYTKATQTREAILRELQLLGVVRS